MILLDTGAAYIVFGTPILAFVLTIVIALIEAWYLNRFTKNFKRTFKVALFANIISTVIGFIIIICFNMYDVFRWITHNTGLTFHLDEGIRGYIGRIILLIFFYLTTILVEIPVFKRYFQNPGFNLSRKIMIANVLSYIMIAVMFFMMN